MVGSDLAVDWRCLTSTVGSTALCRNGCAHAPSSTRLLALRKGPPMNDRTIALLALAFSGFSFILSWKSYRRAGARVQCLFDVENRQGSVIKRRFEDATTSLALRVRNKGMAAIQVSEIRINVGRSFRNMNKGVYTLGQRIPTHDSDESVYVMPALLDVDFVGPALGHVVAGLHTEKWTLDSSKLFEMLAPALAICDQRARAVLVLGDGRELTSNWVTLSMRGSYKGISRSKLAWVKY